MYINIYCMCVELMYKLWSITFKLQHMLYNAELVYHSFQVLQLFRPLFKLLLGRVAMQRRSASCVHRIVHISNTFGCRAPSCLSDLCIIPPLSDANQQPCWNVIAIQQISPCASAAACTLINSPAGIVAPRWTGVLLTMQLLLTNKTKA